MAKRKGPKQQPKREVRIVLGIPLERNITDQAFLCLWQIAQQGMPMIPAAYGRTELRRNDFARQVLNQPHVTHLMMLDTDHIHPVNIVQALARHVIADPSKLVVGALCFRRSEPYDPLMFLRAPDGELIVPGEWPDGLLKVDAIGHGAILIAREVFERIPPPWWLYPYDADFSDPREPYTMPTEDMYFSRLCGEHGIDIWCDTTVTSPHIGQEYIDRSTYDRYVAAHPEKLVPIREKGVIAHAEVRRPVVDPGCPGAGSNGRGSAPVRIGAPDQVGAV